MAKTREDPYAHEYQSIAKRMESLIESRRPAIEYHCFAGALYWSDEIPAHLSVAEENALRPLLRYRTTVALGQPEENCRAAWDLGKRLFPKWIGFSQSRVVWNQDLIEFYRRASAEFDQALEDLFDD